MTRLILCLTFAISLFAEKMKEDYRNYNETKESVKEFYLLNHENQTLDFVLQKKEEFLSLNHAKMSIWEAVELLDTIIDDSDPDLNLPQSIHAYQTAEALRKDGHPRWLILTGFIHDLGKVLECFGEPSWAVVGDTFPVGCAFSDKVVFSPFFNENPDQFDQFGIYEKHCGLDQLEMSWGHDEYLYHVVKNYLPEEALYIIRYHSFYAIRDGGYQHFMNEKDQEMLPWLKLFSKYDLYSKKEEEMDIQALRPYYQELVYEFFGKDQLDW